MKLFAALAITLLAGVAAKAQVVNAYYNQWTRLPDCGGWTRLYCNGPRQNNQCHIEFKDSYNCKIIKLYVGADWYPNRNTTELGMAGDFYVDNNKIGGFFVPSFRVYMDNQGGTPFQKVHYFFNY